MQPLLCALAGLALLRAAGDDPGLDQHGQRAGRRPQERGHGFTCPLAGLEGSAAWSEASQDPSFYLWTSLSLVPPHLDCALPSLLPAEPFVPSRGDPAWNAGCDRHMAVHHRLDVIEETVEKTVEHLEAEVKGLLGQLEELARNLPPGPLGPAPDLLGDGALQLGIPGLLEGLVQFPWAPPSTALDAEPPPPPLAMCPPQGSGAPLGSHAGNPSCVTTEPSDGAIGGCPLRPPCALCSLA
ncbi:placenta-specific protein 9 [Eumetopias jubatus]|uniref:placenta-specific protein 9 n=1 Tax=Eumetopias jubatus TaxID=34886 RepID=UPI0010169CE1|nr:placenta-specific protein 9 [Eumetopias jubatus]